MRSLVRFFMQQNRYMSLILDLGSGFFCHPGSRGQKKHGVQDPQHWFFENSWSVLDQIRIPLDILPVKMDQCLRDPNQLRA
jgi:hypothetical protein